METDFFLFKSLCRSLGNWVRTYGKKISVSINISRGCFSDSDFVPRYTGVMEHFGVTPELIGIELVENSVLEQLDRVSTLVKKLRTAGLKCGLDDFGSGYSSFHILTSIELDELKIDRSLFSDPNNSKERVVLRHILQTAKELGVQTVAEGVEQEDYPSVLQGLGCDYVQGYVFYPPMPTEEFEKRFVSGNEKARVGK